MDCFEIYGRITRGAIQHRTVLFKKKFSQISLKSRLKLHYSIQLTKSLNIES